MKVLLMILGLTLGAMASAETINIQTTSGFGYLHQYHDADTDVADLTVTVYLPQSATTNGMTLWFNDQVVDNYFLSYWVGTYYGSGNVSVLQKCVFAVPSLPCTLNGETLMVTINETHYRKQINAGRAHYWVTKWTLVSGTVER